MANLDLMRNIATKSAAVSKEKQTISELKSKISTWQPSLAHRLGQELENQRKLFQQNQEERRQIVRNIIHSKRDGVAKMIDDSLNIQAPQFVGHDQMESVMQQMKEILPEGAVNGYTCWDPEEIENDQHAFKVYSFLDRFVATNGGGTLPTRVINFLTDALIALVESKGHGGTVAFAFSAIPLVLLLFFPFALPAGLLVLSVFGGANGFVSRIALRKLYSIRRYMTTEYDEDLFNSDREKLLGQVEEYLQSAESEYLGKIDSVVFSPDESSLSTIKQQARADLETWKSQLLMNEQNLEHDSADLEKLQEELAREKASAKDRADNLEQMYFNEVNWEYKWPDRLLFNRRPSNAWDALLWGTDNSLSLFTDKEVLQNFVMLVTYQFVLHVNPFFAQQAVLDYKYMGGRCISLASLPSGVLTVNFGEELTKQLENITDKVHSRIDTILKTSPDLEKFNELMKTYNAPGESYLLTHVCSPSSLDDTWRSILRNGPKVGIFFKFYVLESDLKDLGKDFPVEDFPGLFKVGDSVLETTVQGVKRLLESNS